ncbi:metallophosphoesterase-like protein [Hypoxylon trugodes]|uniref:metallophosphoesterase-like protein n=1 Tax=Hypoxylon trugodes TaxID=326681 RepID=UPI002190D5E7|nr:metallophosphoesterase-like protein [Hypoxylon trugodes]KAI1389680.1 metallophosphoesterase-like protein [Hypoxylon trugodes]
MKLYAIGDLHLSYEYNRKALAELKPHPEDGLILCGDVGETDEHLELAFSLGKRHFKQVFWCPGNHELYSVPAAQPDAIKGEEKYQHCVEVAREHGVHTPEDDFVRWDGEGGPVLIAPIFTLYDYSFRPDHVTRAEAVSWAEETDTVATDEFMLHPDPYPSRDAWCHALVGRFEKKLEQARKDFTNDDGEPLPIVLINHWPLREDLVYIPRVPRFSLWCGTKKTEDWGKRFGAKVVVSGHLHVPRTDWKGGVRYEECSLGYPRQWQDIRAAGKDINDLLREVLPGPSPPPGGEADMEWRRWG